MRSVLCVLLLTGVARADLTDEVKKKAQSEQRRRGNEEKSAGKEADKKSKKALEDLARAEKKLQEAYSKFEKITQEAKKAKERAEQQAKEAEAARADVEKKRAAGQAARALDEAAGRIARGRTDVDELLETAGKDPSLRTAAQALFAAAAYAKGDAAKALAALTPEVVAAFPSARRTLGLAKLKTKDSDGAFKELKQGPLADDDFEAQLALGELAAQTSDHETARAAFGKAHKTKPGEAKAALGLSRALFALGKTAEAAAPLASLATDPSQKEAAYLFAVASERSGDPAKAELAFARVVGADAAKPASAPSYAKPGRSLHVVPTLPPFGVVPLTMDEPSARVRLAWYRLQRGDHDAARTILDKADRADALYVRGLAQLRAGRLDAARADFEKSMKADAKRNEARHAYAVALLESGDAQKAQAAFAAVEDPAARVGEAVALAKLQKRAEAEKLLSAQKGEAVAVNLAILRREGGDRDGAWKLLPDRPSTPESWQLRGLLAFERGDSRVALQCARSATAEAPNFVDAWILQARAAEAANDLATQKEAARRALEISPDAVDARVVLARAYGKEGDSAAQSAELAKLRELGEKVSSLQQKRAIAVVAFENHSGDASLDWMKQGVAEALVTDLSRLSTLTIIERTQVQKAFQEKRLQELGFADPSQVTQVGKLVGADAILVGQILKTGDQLRLDGRVVEVGTNKILKTGAATGRASDLFEIERRLALDLVSEYAALTPREKVDMFAAQKTSLESLQTLARIRALSHEGKEEAARAAYQKLLASDPKAAKQLADLQKVWQEGAASVAVVPLINASGRPEDGWIGVGLAESLTTDLRKLGLFMVERQQVEKLMQERRLTEIFNEQQAVKLGKLVGASLLVIGSFQAAGAQLRVDARLVDVSTGQILQSYGIEGKKDELFDVERKLVAAMGERLKVDPAKLDKSETPSLEAFKRYIQSSSKLLVKDGAGVVNVRTVAVAPIAGIGGAVRTAMEKHARVAIRAAASDDAKSAGADALVVGSLTKSGARVRVDLRAILASNGEVVASATAEGAVEEEARVVEQAAQMLVSQLGLAKTVAQDKKSETPAYKKWWVWTIVGVVVAGGVTAGAVLGTQAQTIPSSNATIIAR